MELGGCGEVKRTPLDRRCQPPHARVTQFSERTWRYDGWSGSASAKHAISVHVLLASPREHPDRRRHLDGHRRSPGRPLAPMQRWRLEQCGCCSHRHRHPAQCGLDGARQRRRKPFRSDLHLHDLVVPGGTIQRRAGSDPIFVGARHHVTLRYLAQHILPCRCARQPRRPPIAFPGLQDLARAR